jgi:hypothetical protein
MALLGHSGGSVVSNLTVRLRPDLVAYVLDLTSEYINWYLGEFIDETAPSIWDYFPQINDFTTSSVPVHREPYGYEGDVTPTVDFLRARLALAG